MTKIQVNNAHRKIPADVLELLRTLAYQCENANNGDHSGSFVGVDEALDFIEQVESTVKGNKQERSAESNCSALHRRISELEDGLRQIALWKQEDQDNHETCILQWRGCVAIARELLKPNRYSVTGNKQERSGNTHE